MIAEGISEEVAANPASCTGLYLTKMPGIVSAGPPNEVKLTGKRKVFRPPVHAIEFCVS